MCAVVISGKLARREREILRFAFGGLAPKEIAGEMRLETATINRRLVLIAAKLGVKRQQVLKWTMQNPASIRRDVTSESSIEFGLHRAGCPCSSPDCQAARIIAA